MIKQQFNTTSALQTFGIITAATALYHGNLPVRFATLATCAAVACRRPIGQAIDRFIEKQIDTACPTLSLD